MAAMTPTTITLLARVGDSPVLNEIATIEVDVEWRAIQEGDNAPTEAEGVVTVNLAAALREAADRIDAGE
jgi:hypothetical protein